MIIDRILEGPCVVRTADTESLSSTLTSVEVAPSSIDLQYKPLKRGFGPTLRAGEMAMYVRCKVVVKALRFWRRVMG